MEEMCSHSHWFCIWGQFLPAGGWIWTNQSSKVQRSEIAWCIIQNVRGSGLQGTFFVMKAFSKQDPIYDLKE